MKTIQEMISVMQAAQEGKAIECTLLGKNEWSPPDAFETWAWNWNEFDYRVKPESSAPNHLTFIRIHDTYNFLGPYMVHLAGDKRDTVEFIELTPEIKAKLGL